MQQDVKDEWMRRHRRRFNVPPKSRGGTDCQWRNSGCLVSTVKLSTAQTLQHLMKAHTSIFFRCGHDHGVRVGDHDKGKVEARRERPSTPSRGVRNSLVWVSTSLVADEQLKHDFSDKKIHTRAMRRCMCAGSQRYFKEASTVSIFVSEEEGCFARLHLEDQGFALCFGLFWRRETFFLQFGLLGVAPLMGKDSGPAHHQNTSEDGIWNFDETSVALILASCAG